VVIAPAFIKRAQHVTTNTTKPVYGNVYHRLR
jgi:hypothetical protein